MSITETLTKVIDEVLDEREKEMILICLDYEFNRCEYIRHPAWEPNFINGWPSYATVEMIWERYHKRTTRHHIRTKVKSAMTKLEKSAKLRAISEFSP